MSDEPLWRRRCAKLWRWLAERPIDGLLVLARPNVTYLTGFTGDSSYLVVTREDAVIVSDSRYEQQIAEECPGLRTEIRSTGREQLLPFLARVIRSLDVEALAYEAHVMTVVWAEQLQPLLPHVIWTPVRDVVEEFRAIKEPDEVKAIRHAVRLAEQALVETIDRVDWSRPPTEAEFAGLLNAAMRRLGAVDESFRPIVASGPRAAMPHASLSATERLSLEDGILVDWGARYGQYVSDLTRIIARTRMLPSLQEAIERVNRSKDQVIAALRPGAAAGELHRCATEVLERAGASGIFRHGLGHGIGLEVHERPFLRAGADDKLTAGMVVTIEPGVYLPGQYGVRIEEDVLVTEDGAEVLSSLPHVLTVD